MLHEVSQDVQQGVYGKSLAVPSPAGDQQLSFNVAIKPIKISLVSGGAGSEPGLGKTWKWWCREHLLRAVFAVLGGDTLARQTLL